MKKQDARTESRIKARSWVITALLLTGALLVGIAGDSSAEERTAAQAAFADLKADFPGVKAYTQESGHITRLYGRPFGSGDSPQLAAEAFRLNHSAVLGARADDLLPISRLKDRRHTQPMMYNNLTGEY